MLLLPCIVLLIAFSSAERPPKQPRHSNRSTNAVDSRRHSARVSNQIVSVADSQFPEVQDYETPDTYETDLESTSTSINFDILQMRDSAASLLGSFEDIRNQLVTEEKTFMQPSGEVDDLRDSVATNIAVIRLALENIKGYLSTQDSNQGTDSVVEGPPLENLSVLLDRGEKEWSKLRGRLMQVKKQWLPSSAHDAVAIDIKTSSGNQKNTPGFQIRQLLPESLLQQLQDYDEDQSVVALPPSHFGSGLLSDTGHEDVNLSERREQQIDDTLITEDQEIVEDQAVDEFRSNQQGRQQLTPTDAQSSTLTDADDISIDTLAATACSYSISALFFSLIVIVFLV